VDQIEITKSGTFADGFLEGSDSLFKNLSVSLFQSQGGVLASKVRLAREHQPNLQHDTPANTGPFWCWLVDLETAHSHEVIFEISHIAVRNFYVSHLIA
jgi:hypothetical protein